MLLNEVINRMEQGEGQTKSAAAPEEAPEAKLNKALEKAAGEETPPAEEAPVDAVETLFKTANALAGTEKEAELAHAALCGQAFADGAIAKFAAYDAQMQTVKTAQAPAQQAMSDEALVKAAAEAGYQETLEKLSAEYEAGHNAALQDVHDQAASEFLKGAAEVEVMVNLAQQQSAEQ